MRRRRRQSHWLFPAIFLCLVIFAIVKAAIVVVPVLFVGIALAVTFSVRDGQRKRAELAEAHRIQMIQRAEAERVRMLRQAEAQRIQMIRSFEVAPYHQMDARQFEEAIAYLCHRDGCPRAQRTGKAGDLGADVVATTPDGRKMVIQCKRYATGNLVTGPDLQKFAGTVFTIHDAQVAMLVTTSSFTKQAKEIAARTNILLLDADGLAAWASRTAPPPWAVVPARS